MPHSSRTTAESGFTIVEVLVALTIFSVAVAGVITVAVQGGMNVNSAKYKVTATYLADEGIELMRAMRDTSVLGASTEALGWSAFTAAFGGTATAPGLYCTASAPCDIDPANTSPGAHFPAVSNVVPCASDGACPLYYLPSGYYSPVNSGGARSPFSRRITASVDAGSPDELKVVSTVTWMEGTRRQSVSASESIFNWY